MYTVYESDCGRFEGLLEVRDGDAVFCIHKDEFPLNLFTDRVNINGYPFQHEVTSGNYLLFLSTMFETEKVEE